MNNLLQRRLVHQVVNRFSIVRGICSNKVFLTKENVSARTPGHFVTPADRFWIRVTKTLPPEQITSEVSAGIMEKTNDRRRILINLTILVSIGILCFAIVKPQSKRRRERLRKKEDEQLD